MSTAARVALGDELDPLRSPLLDAELPGLRTALDPDAVRGHLQAALRPTRAIVHSAPGQATYLGDRCMVRYQLELEGDPPSTVLVTGRVFADRETCARYVEERLAPLAEAARGREEHAGFAAPVGMVEPLRMAVQVFPVDGELPTLVDATDPERMLGVLRAALAAAGEDDRVEGCRVELGHYGRQHRCVLRYHLDAGAAGDGARAPGRLVYGKVAGDDRGTLAEPVTSALRSMLADDGLRGFGVPRCLGYLPDLQLALFEAIPGVPQVAQLLKARIKGGPAVTPGGLTLEGSVEACARIAAALHTSGIGLGRSRTFGGEAAGLRSGFALVRRVSPGLGERLDAWLDLAEERAGASDPLPAGFAHGDFSYTQLIFDGTRSGLVDFDTVCQSEPALDLGQFLAYLAVAARKARTPDGPDAGTLLAGRLGARFVDAYAEAAGAARAELLDRAAVYEIVSLLRLAFHSWQKLKRSRLEHVVDVLDERVPELAARR